MIKSLDKQKIQALNKEKIKTDTKCLHRQFRHKTGTTCDVPQGACQKLISEFFSVKGVRVGGCPLNGKKSA